MLILPFSTYEYSRLRTITGLRDAPWRPLTVGARAVPMIRSDAYEIPGGVRLLLSAFATVAILAGFWLASGPVG